MPQISAPSRSAEYSRVREIAICTTVAASGARIITRIAAIGLVRSPSREPPKKKANWPRKPMAPAMVAAMVMVSVSRFLMCASSCAITPASSSRLRLCISPRVTATALWCGSRPVANALGWSVSIR